MTQKALVIEATHPELQGCTTMNKVRLSVKQKLEVSITQLSEVSWIFSQKPGVYFTRDRKLPFPKVISCLHSIEGGSLTSELLKYFGCYANISSSSAFVQQRRKISEEAFPMLFSLFVKKIDYPKLYKGLRLIATDVSDIHIPQVIMILTSRESMDRPLIICSIWMLSTICSGTPTLMHFWLVRERLTREAPFVPWSTVRL